MPDPFRNYEGVPVLDLPADPFPPAIPALEVLHNQPGATKAVDGPGWLSELMYHSAAISAVKIAPGSGSQYALRVNPSSGNLHPTEFHFITSDLRDWPDGLYHYRASAHMAEQRAMGTFANTTAPVVFLLTSIAWREAWKYRDRAYRYCLHDVGHAWQSLSLAARALGCESFARGQFIEDRVAALYDLPSDEWPMLMVEIRGPAIPMNASETMELKRFGGQPNLLSAEEISYPSIHRIHRDTSTISRPGLMPSRPFGEVTRRRRSALDFHGGSMSLPQFQAILDAATQPLSADFYQTPFIQLYTYVHGVDGLEPGVYRGLELIKPGDQRIAAAGLSLGQDLAGNACVAFSMVADLERATRIYGDRGYRYVHFEAGAIGHRMYLAAESLGLQATGIGAFFDDRARDYLDITPEQGQVVYHFAIGHAVVDRRISPL